MSVVGIDFGNESAVIALAHKGQIDIVVNEVSHRKTPTVAGFSDVSRYLGESGLGQQKSNYKRTITQVKRFLGRRFSQADVQHDLQSVQFKTVQGPNDEIRFEVPTKSGALLLSPEQVAGAVIGKLKQISEFKGVHVSDCVIGCPAYFTDKERRALMDACRIAGLTILRVMNESTAVALNYGILRSLPEKEAIAVMFVDVGQASTSVAVVSFKVGELTVLGTAANRSIGGRDFDALLARHFSDEIKQKHNLDPFSKPKPYLRVMDAAKKAKLMLSANKVAHTGVECLMEDTDASWNISRDQFNTLTKPLVDQIMAVVQQALENTKLTPEKLHSIEIIGGGSRVNAIREGLTELFGRPLSTTLNADESVARGCALQCAMLSPAFRVRNFQVHDVTPYPVEVCWGPVTDDYASPNCVFEETAELFAQYNSMPNVKMISFVKVDPFQIVLRYSNPSDVPAGQAFLARCIINPPPIKDPEATQPKIKVKIQMSLHGTIGIKSVQVQHEIKEVEQPQVESPVVASPTTSETPKSDDATSSQTEGDDTPTASTPKSEDVPMEPESPTENGSAMEDEGASEEQGGDDMDLSSAEKSFVKEEKPKKKKKIKRTDLPYDMIYANGLTDDEFKLVYEQEVEMANQDRIVEETLQKRNELESYVYDTRGKLGLEWKDYVADAIRDEFLDRLNKMEDWLYSDEGYDASKSQYTKQTKELRKTGDEIELRRWETEHRNEAVSILKANIVKYQMFLVECEKGEGKEAYDHITAEERKKVGDEVNSADEWLVSSLSKQDKLKKSENVSFTVADCRKKLDSINNICYPIHTKKKPIVKVEEEKPKTEETDQDNATNDVDAPAAGEKDQNPESPSKDPLPEVDVNMDVD